MNDLFSSNHNFFNPLSLQTSSPPPRISKYLFTSKPSFLDERYQDLDVFRQQLTESRAGLHHQPYTNNKKNTIFYKTTFLSLAALFFLLAMTTLAIPSAVGCGFFFSSCTFLKTILVTICTFFSLTSLTLALRLKAEKEAVAYFARKTKAYVATIYTRKQLRAGIKSLFAIFGKNRLKAITLKQMYHETCDKINDKKDEALHLVHRIKTAETLTAAEKENLLNQAIEEFHQELQKLAHGFRNAPTDAGRKGFTASS